MRSVDVLRLLLLAAIWGGSFFFMKIAAPVLGAAWLMEGRVLFAAIFLALLARLLKKNPQLLTHWKHFLFMGAFNCAVPWLLFGFAALRLTTGQLSILNSTAPIFAFVIGLFIRTEKFSLKRGLGLLFGVIGVAVLFGDSGNGNKQVDALGVLMSLGATLCYGITTNYTIKVKKVPAFDNALGSMWAAAFVLIPVLCVVQTPSSITTPAVLSTLAIGVLCSGVALLIYFKLVQTIGAASALSVTFLIPVFGTFWGVLLLNEALTLQSLLGMLIILSGTALVTGFSPMKLIIR